MRIVGLTGGIASGKSTVGRILAENGVDVIDADQVARDVVEPGSPVLAAIRDAFGPDVLDAEGRLDRAAMRERITEDSDARSTLNQLTHPAIRERIARWLTERAQAKSAMAVVEAALLVETGSHTMYPELLVVSCSPETQVSRVMARDAVSEDQARAIIATQLPLEEKEALATQVLRNDSDLEALETIVRAWLASGDQT